MQEAQFEEFASRMWLQFRRTVIDSALYVTSALDSHLHFVTFAIAKHGLTDFHNIHPEQKSASGNRLGDELLACQRDNSNGRNPDASVQQHR